MTLEDKLDKYERLITRIQYRLKDFDKIPKEEIFENIKLILRDIKQHDKLEIKMDMKIIILI